MNKQEFLSALECRLKKEKIDDINDVVDYYDEMIEDKKEFGEYEEDIIKNLGNVNDVAKMIRLEQQIKKAEKNPNVSNGAKVLFAVLGVFSTPILLPIVIALGACIIALAAVAFAIVITIICVIVYLIALSIHAFISLFTVSMPVYGMFIILGVSLLLISLMILMLQASIIQSKKITAKITQSVKNKMNNKGALK